MIKALFVTWDAPEAPYLETLFIPLFQRLRRFGYRVDVLQFTWADSERLRRLEHVAASASLTYTAMPMARRATAQATAWAVARGATAIARHVRTHGTRLVLPRSIIPAAMALAAREGSSFRLVYEADGLAADERVDFAGWNPNGVPYFMWRAVEAAAVRTAAGVVTRTHAARRILMDRAGAGIDTTKIAVVPNGRDAAAFTPGTSQSRADVRHAWGASPNAPCLVFAGSVGPQYYPAEMVALHRRVLARHPEARLLFFTPHVDAARSVIAKEESARVRDSVRVLALPPTAIPHHLAGGDLGLAFRAPTFSQQAVSPIKIAEYLLCGVPVASTPVGDVGSQIGEEDGILIDAPGAPALDRIADWFDDRVLPHRDAVRARCRATGVSEFDLDVIAARYAAALDAAMSDARAG